MREEGQILAVEDLNDLREIEDELGGVNSLQDFNDRECDVGYGDVLEKSRYVQWLPVDHVDHQVVGLFVVYVVVQVYFQQMRAVVVLGVLKI